MDVGCFGSLREEFRGSGRLGVGMPFVGMGMRFVGMGMPVSMGMPMSAAMRVNVRGIRM